MKRAGAGWTTTSLLCLLLSNGLACGAAEKTRSEPVAIATAAAPTATAGSERPAMLAQGLTGSLSTIEVARALEPRSGPFSDCFADHSHRMSTVGGRVEFAFRVAVNGDVASVKPTDSTVGHREIERCLVDIARGTRFPRPHGGEAEFTWSLELDPPDDVRHPITWDPSRVAAVVRRRGREALAECRQDGRAAGTSRFQVTTYVSRQGRVLAAGAVADADESEDSLDCIVREVRRWQMPRHRQHLAKVTFDLH